MSNTPKTDECYEAWGFSVPLYILCLELERDLAAANAKLAALQALPPADVSAAEWAELRALLDMKHEHVEGRNECAICDESLVSAAIREIKQYRALQASPDVAGLVERKVPESLTYAHLTDKQMADKVRMLLRSDLDFEPVCSGGRDRIRFLSEHCDKQADALLSISAKLAEKEAECEGLKDDSRRYKWLANRVLACDYGDNDADGEQIGWRIRHDLLPGKIGQRQPAFMYGSSIDTAIDAAIAACNGGIKGTLGPKEIKP